jgi:hypothetical protein
MKVARRKKLLLRRPAIAGKIDRQLDGKTATRQAKKKNGPRDLGLALARRLKLCRRRSEFNGLVDRKGEHRPGNQDKFNRPPNALLQKCHPAGTLFSGR